MRRLARYGVVIGCALGLAVGCAADPAAGDGDGDGDGVDCSAVDTESDPQNCGACGRTCVIPNAAAGCELGECVIASCEVGFADDDGELDNGCELDEGVIVSNECTTECGSIGTLDPADETGQTCVLPDETCNALDDDCDGTCDEDRPAGCRVAVHRAFGDGHLYTTDLAAAQTNPFSVESQNYFYIYAEPSVAAEAIYLCRKPDGKHLLTPAADCEGTGNPVGTLGAWAPADGCGAVPLYRAYHPPTNNHFFTLNAGERDNAVASFGYVSEGIAGYVWPAP